MNGKSYAYSGQDVKSAEDARTRALNRISVLETQLRNSGVANSSSIANAARAGLVAYKNGGYVDFTGPAWVDGTPGKPEYMLNAGQTKLMESLVAALETTVRVPKMPAFNTDMLKGAAAGYTFNGGINIEVDSLATDDDYETIAEKVKQSIVEAMTHGKSIGY